MTTTLMVDPVSKRIAFVAFDGRLPSRVTILHDGRQYLFAPSGCELVHVEEPLPVGFFAQKSWDYRWTGAQIEKA